MVTNLPIKVSATKPPNKQSMKEVPMKLVTVLAELALPKCIVPVKYVTKFTATPIVVNLSHASTPENSTSKTTKGNKLTTYVNNTVFSSPTHICTHIQRTYESARRVNINHIIKVNG